MRFSAAAAGEHTHTRWMAKHTQSGLYVKLPGVTSGRKHSGITNPGETAQLQCAMQGCITATNLSVAAAACRIVPWGSYCYDPKTNRIFLMNPI